MTDTDIQQLARKMLSSALKNRAKQLCYAEDDGLLVSTVVVPGQGPETAICDASGNHTVELYTTEAAARAGHKRWVDAVENGLKEVTRLAFVVDGETLREARQIKLLRNSDFAGPRDIDPTTVQVEQWPFARRGSRVRINGEIVVDAREDLDGTYVDGYLAMLRRRVMGQNPKKPVPAGTTELKPGSFLTLDKDGPKVSDKPPTGRAPQMRVCTRLADHPTQPEGTELDTCAGCSALVYYSTNSDYQDLPRVCTQCMQRAVATGRHPLER